MIASLRGIIRTIAADHLVLETGGVGFRVYVPRPLLGRVGAVGDEAGVQTVLIVREDALTLYGFGTDQERRLFETLLTISGVGPRVALALLSAATPEEVHMAVARKDTARFARVSGIGKKLAERLVLELTGKLDVARLPGGGAAAGAGAADGAPAGAGAATTDTELAELLVSLGYSVAEASAAIGALPPDAPTDLEARLRLALRYFGGA